MNIYLDVDGVLLTKAGKETNFVKEFLEHVVKNHQVYWLTTHCNGDAMFTVRFLERFFDDETIEIMKNILPTSWITLKTEAIDFSKPFLWFDDNVFNFEKEILKQHNCLKSLIEILLEEDPDQLNKYLKI
ncbi:MAG: hypothetical protein PHS54_03295 [Clostridia bacterium]|nr:hypothetical protein [Clostridia bacterium]